MRKLIIRNLGPLAEVEISTSDINIIIGTQSSGKSCILKMACYCAWVEKRLAITQNKPRWGCTQLTKLQSIY